MFFYGSRRIADPPATYDRICIRGVDRLLHFALKNGCPSTFCHLSDSVTGSLAGSPEVHGTVVCASNQKREMRTRWKIRRMCISGPGGSECEFIGGEALRHSCCNQQKTADRPEEDAFANHAYKCIHCEFRLCRLSNPDDIKSLCGRDRFNTGGKAGGLSILITPGYAVYTHKSRYILVRKQVGVSVIFQKSGGELFHNGHGFGSLN